MKKLLLMLSVILMFITPISAEDPANTGSDQGYEYDGDDTSYSQDNHINYWPVNDICKINYNTNNTDSGNTGIIYSVVHSEYDTTVGTYSYTSGYEFKINGRYFGLYEDSGDEALGLKEAVAQCSSIYNAVNDIIDAVYTDDRDYFVYNGHEYSLNPKSTCKGDECGLVSNNKNKEEALKRFFILASQHHITSSWKSEPPEEIVRAENYYEDILDHSIIADMFYPVFDVQLRNGSILGYEVSEVRKREEINSSVLNNTSGRVSAYQRFGPNISFVPYYGEQSYKLNLFDKIYSAVAQDKIDSLQDVVDIFDELSVTLSTIAYKDRAPALYDLLDNRVDPRLNVMSVTRRSAIGSAAAIGNLFLSCAKVILSIINIFITDRLQTAIFNIIENFMLSSVWSAVFVPAINVGIAFGIVGFIFSLVKHGKAYGQGKEDARPFLGRFIGNLFVLGLLFVLATRPTALNNIPKKILDINTKVTARMLVSAAHNKSYTDDVVETSSFDNSAIESAIWRTAIFNPWCRGMFQADYDNLFTHYAVDRLGVPLDDYYKTDQSYQDPLTTDKKYYHSADATGAITYDSAYMTGDVGVPLGDGYESKNWAIFAWSTQSIYHIDSDRARYIYVDDEGNEEQLEVGWPNAKVSPNNPSIYQDSFRWIDAKLNISPGYTYSGLKVYNYLDAKPYHETFVVEGVNSVIYVLCLLVMFPTIFIKLKSSILLILLTVQVIGYGILNLFKEKSFTQIFPNYFNTIKDYFVASLKIIIMLNIYSTLLNKPTFIKILLFILLSIIIQLATVEKAKNLAVSAYKFMKYGEAGIDKTNISVFIHNKMSPGENGLLQAELIKSSKSSTNERVYNITQFLTELRNVVRDAELLKDAIEMNKELPGYYEKKKQTINNRVTDVEFRLVTNEVLMTGLSSRYIIHYLLHPYKNNLAQAKDKLDEIISGVREYDTVDELKGLCEKAKEYDMGAGTISNKEDYIGLGNSGIFIRYKPLTEQEKAQKKKEDEDKKKKETKEKAE